MNALLSAQGDAQTPLVNGDAFSTQLFGLLDTNGDGSISQSEMDSIFNKNGDTTKADAIFAKLDANHDGSVSPDELTNALSGQGQAGQGGQGQEVHHRHRHHHLADLIGANSPAGGGNSNDPFSSSTSNDPFAGDSSQTVTNTDGSSTTTITYADGSQVSMTTPAASSSGSNPSAMAHNSIERMIQRQAQMMASTTVGQGLAISA
jgi:Ca2+-binding EF-hand superfamily protein